MYGPTASPSRANLLRGLVAAGTKTAATASDRDLKAAIEATINAAALNAQYVNIVVADGDVTIRGTVESKAEQSALGIAAEEVAGVGRVVNRIGVKLALVRTSIGTQ